VKVAFVVQRYGEDVNGGAEALCRALAERLVRRPEISELTVLTTCARDHLTWANHYAAGETRVGGVRVERFPVRTRRMPRVQKRLFDQLVRFPRARWIERLWLWTQGPWSPALLDRIREVHARYDAFVFVTYLYHPTVRGLPLVRERAVLLSTAHDEDAIRAPIFAELFRAARRIACLTPEERDFLLARFGLEPARLDVVGSGLDAPRGASERGLPAAAAGAPYLLYVGRIESEKGVPELLEGFAEFTRRHGERTFTADDGRPYAGSELRLLLAGRADARFPVPPDPRVVALGFVSDEAKQALLAGCLALVAPSRYESLSLVLLEAWQQHRPVLVNAHCEVTRAQAARASGGAAYDGASELAEAIARAAGDPAWRSACGASGSAYAAREYGWPAVEERWLKLLSAVAS
jgi:glycosyltransferase involved in cell wall biosynthesis